MSYMRSSDLSRGMTLRNASEHRRLEGHIKTLDAQLKQNLVSLQAEIMEVKASPYAGRRSRSRSPARPHGFSSGTHQHTRRFQAEDQEANGDFANGNQRLHKRGLPRIQVSGNANDSCSDVPFLPKINTEDTWLVSKGSQESLSPPTHRRARSPGSSTRNLSVAPHATNLYRPRSSPNIFTKSTDDSGGASSGTRQQRPKDRLQAGEPLVPGEDSVVKKDSRRSRSNERSNAKGGDFGANERQKGSQVSAHAVKTEEPDEENASGNLDTSEGEKGEQLLTRDLYCDEELFRNSLLLKASREDGLSTSLPDLKSLGFMDFNEVIDQRLRQLQEEIPSKEEMRKIRYLRFRDEPPPPDILSVFDKDS